MFLSGARFRGSFGKVILAVSKQTGQEFAVKIMDKKRFPKPKDREDMRREIEIMRQVSHPHICRVYEFYEDSKELCIVMELYVFFFIRIKKFTIC